MTIEQLTAFISSVGFPIAVACVLLWRFDNQNKGTVRALHELTMSLDKLIRELVRKTGGL